MESNNSDGAPRHDQWKHLLASDSDAPLCTIWTGSYRKNSGRANPRVFPVLYYDNSRVCARAIIAAFHGMCAFADNVCVTMRCNNPRCVAHTHMVVAKRTPRTRPPTTSLKRSYPSSLTDESSQSYSSSVTHGSCCEPPCKRARPAPDAGPFDLSHSAISTTPPPPPPLTTFAPVSRPDE